MKKITRNIAVMAAGGLLALGSNVNAVEEGELLFADDFDTDSSSNWTVFTGAQEGYDDWEANFGWDYSQHGIPAAPNSTGGTTRGLQMKVNKWYESAYGISAFPNGQHFAGDYVVKFDLWINFNGNIGPTMPAGGGPTTEHVVFGLGAPGDFVQQFFNPPAAQNPEEIDFPGQARGALFAMNGDGGSGSLGEYRAYANGISQAPSGGGYPGGTDNTTTRKWSNPYYHSIVPGGATVPAAQLALQAADAGQNPATYDLGQTPAGAPGFMWHEVELEVRGGIVRWYLSGLLIAEITPDNASLPEGSEFMPTEGNIHFGHLDQFSSLALYDSKYCYGLFDNLRVYSLPEAGGFASWAEGISDSEARGPSDNPSGDGISNLLKYALGLDPNVADVNGLPTGVVEADGGADYLTLTVSKNPEAADVALVVQVSSDLVNWDSGEGHTHVLVDDDTTLKVRDETAISANERRFIRVQATMIE